MPIDAIKCSWCLSITQRSSRSTWKPGMTYDEAVEAIKARCGKAQCRLKSAPIADYEQSRRIDSP